jgi:hypothetical protein
VPETGGCLFTDDQEELQAALEGNRGWAEGDMDFYSHELEQMRPNRQVLWNVTSANVFYALVPDRYWRLGRTLEASLRGQADRETGLQMRRPVQVLGAMGAALISTAHRERLAELPMAWDIRTWFVRRNPDPAPLAYFADTIVPCWDAQAALEQMCAPGFSWRRPPVELRHEDALSLSPADAGAEVTRVQDDCGHVTVGCRTTGTRLLVLRETYDPHFRCLVDGAPTRIFRANYLFRGVVVGPGEHRVEFIYDAWDLRAGAVISLATLLAMLAFLVVTRRAARRAQTHVSPSH